MKDVKPIAIYWIRDVKVLVFNISKVFSNFQALEYQESNYEIAVDYFSKKDIPNTIVYLNKFMGENGHQKSSDLMLTTIFFQNGQFERVYTIATNMANRYKTDFFVNMQCGQMLQAIGIITKDQKYISLSHYYYKQATIYNPYKSDFIMTQYQNVIKTYNK